MGDINNEDFQRQFELSVLQGTWTEEMGRYMLILVDNIAYSGILNANKSVIEELKGDLIMSLVEGLWKYEPVGNKSKAIYYAIAIVRNKLRRISKERVGGRATKTLQGTDCFAMKYDANDNRLRRVRAQMIPMAAAIAIPDEDNY